MNAGTPIVNKFAPEKVLRTPLTPCRRVGLGRPCSGSVKKTKHTPRCSITPRVLKSEKSQTPVNVNKETEQLKSYPGLNQRLETPLASSDDLNQNSEPRRNLRLSTAKRLNVKRALNDCGNSKATSSDHPADDFDTLSLSICSNSLKTLNCQGSYSKKQKIICDKNLSHENLLSDPSPVVETHQLHVASRVASDSESTLNNENVTSDMIRELVSSIKRKKNRLDLMKVQHTYSKKHDLEDLRAQTSKWRLAGQEALRHSVNLAKEAGLPVTISQLIREHGFSADLILYNEEDDDFF